MFVKMERNFIFAMSGIVLLIALFASVLGQVVYVNQQIGYHPLQQVSRTSSDLTSVDLVGNVPGAIDLAYTLPQSSLDNFCSNSVGCNEGYKSCKQLSFASNVGPDTHISLNDKCLTGGCEMFFVVQSSVASNYFKVKFSQFDTNVVIGQGSATNNPQRWRSWVHGSSGSVVSNTGINGNSNEEQVAFFQTGTYQVTLKDDSTYEQVSNKLSIVSNLIGGYTVNGFVC